MAIYTACLTNNAPLIKLGESFNVLKKRIAKESILYSVFCDYYDKYFETARNNGLFFDYITNGQVLLDAKIIINTDEEQDDYNAKRMNLSKFMAEYLIACETHSINPYDIYNNKVAQKRIK